MNCLSWGSESNLRYVVAAFCIECEGWQFDDGLIVRPVVKCWSTWLRYGSCLLPVGERKRKERLVGTCWSPKKCIVVKVRHMSEGVSPTRVRHKGFRTLVNVVT